MAKQSESKTVQVVLFVEGETDEVFFKALMDYYRTVSTTELHPCRIYNLRGVTRYSSKLLATLRNEFLPEAKKKGQRIQTVCCSYDTDVFETGNPQIVDWSILRKAVKRLGIEEFIQLGIKSSIEDWLLCDQEGICRFLKLKEIPKTLKGNSGNEKLNDLFVRAKKIYQKGRQTQNLVAALDMGVIRNKNKNVLEDLEKALNVRLRE
ncbi:MAG: hypothetical protein J6X51_06365 [Bacteroidales bacterium]|nr:hypothetical protein [Bacteroidales bacterium]